mgnify:CR=1 FL=1
MRKTKILIGLIVFLVLAGLLVLAMTKPDRAAHYETVKKEVLAIVDREMNSNPVLRDFAALGTLTALNVMDGYLGRFLVVRDHTFYTVGVIIYKDQPIPISVGVLNHVWLTADEDDLERVMRNSDVMKALQIEKLDDVKNWKQHILNLKQYRYE